MTTDHYRIFVLPALGVAPGYYALLVQALEQLPAQVSVLAPESPQRWRQRLLGQVQVGYGDMVARIVAAVHASRTQDPQRPVVLLGHSLGGHFALAAAARLGRALHGVALVASGTPHWGAWPAAEQARLRRGIGTIGVVNALLPWYPGAWLGFGGHQSRRLMHDWGVLARTGRLASVNGLQADAAAFATLTTPVLSLRVEGDHLAPPAATDHLLAEFPQLEHQARTLSATLLPGVPRLRRHFAWCRHPASVMPDLRHWLQSLKTD